MAFWRHMNPFRRKDSAVASIIAAQGGTAKWSPRNYKNFAEEAYMKNVIAYRCVLKIAESVSSVSWGMKINYGKDSQKWITDHWMNDVIRRPNPQDSYSFLMLSLAAYFAIAGNGYVERVGPTTGPNMGAMKEMYVHRPDRIRLATDEKTGRITKYIYSIGGYSKNFDVDLVSGRCDLLHMKKFHPTNDYFGFADTEAAAREIDTSNEAIQWQKKLLENEARLGLVYIVVGELTKTQYERLEKQLKGTKAGSDNAGESIILQGEKGTDVKPYSWSPKELDWIESNRELSRNIAIGYGVPPILLNIPGDTTFRNYEEARAFLWEDTVLYYLNAIRDAKNNWLFGAGETKEFIQYDLDEVPAFQEKRAKLRTQANELRYLTINEKRGLAGYDPVPGGDVILVSATEIPLGAEVDEGEEETEKEKRLRKILEKGDLDPDLVSDLMGYGDGGNGDGNKRPD